MCWEKWSSFYKFGERLLTTDTMGLRTIIISNMKWVSWKSWEDKYLMSFFSLKMLLLILAGCNASFFKILLLVCFSDSVQKKCMPKYYLHAICMISLKTRKFLPGLGHITWIAGQVLACAGTDFHWVILVLPKPAVSPPHQVSS